LEKIHCINWVEHLWVTGDPLLGRHQKIRVKGTRSRRQGEIPIRRSEASRSWERVSGTREVLKDSGNRIPAEEWRGKEQINPAGEGGSTSRTLNQTRDETVNESNREKAKREDEKWGKL